MNINSKLLSDPLSELPLPNCFARLGINHHSSTSLGYPEGVYVWRYIKCSQEDRRKFDGNANMAAGVAVGNALSYIFANTIWKMNPLTKKLAPVKNEFQTDDEAIDKAMEKFRQYKPVDDIDQEKFEHYLTTIPPTIRQGIKILRPLCGDKHIVCEDVVGHRDKRLKLSIDGRTDFSVQDLRKEKSLPGVRHGTKTDTPVSDLLSVLELKTSWQKPMKRKKDGSRSFAYARLPLLPNKSHLQQLSFYYTAQRPADAKLIYLTADGSKVFDKGNCADLEPANMKNYYEELVRSAIRRERLLTRYEHINDTEQMKLEIIKDCDPQFNHPFYWRIGNHYLQMAKDLWKNI